MTSCEALRRREGGHAFDPDTAGTKVHKATVAIDPWQLRGRPRARFRPQHRHGADAARSASSRRFDSVLLLRMPTRTTTSMWHVPSRK
jgi:hypothetical protein